MRSGVQNRMFSVQQQQQHHRLRGPLFADRLYNYHATARKKTNTHARMHKHTRSNKHVLKQQAPSSDFPPRWKWFTVFLQLFINYKCHSWFIKNQNKTTHQLTYLKTADIRLPYLCLRNQHVFTLSTITKFMFPVNAKIIGAKWKQRLGRFSVNKNNKYKDIN